MSISILLPCSNCILSYSADEASAFSACFLAFFSASMRAIASLICGILSLVICTCCCGGTGWIPLLLGIAAIVTAIVSKNGQKMSGMATGGLVCGIIAVVLALAVLVMGLFVFDDNFWMNFSDEFLTEFEASLPEGYESFLPEDYYQYME